MNTSTVNYDALAAQQGGSAAAAGVDYDALAAQHGGAAQDDQSNHADQMHAEIKAAPGGLKQWLGDLESDLKYGTGNTLPGRVMKTLGAPGIARGTSEQTGNIVAGPLIGPVHTAQGVADIPQHPIAGAMKAASGALETAGPALAFSAPEASEAAASLAGKAAESLSPGAMKEAAGKLFQDVATDANKMPVQLKSSHDAALRLMDWQSKTQLGPTLNKFLNRVTSGSKGPMTYEEARDFQQLISKMSVDENLKMAAPVKFQVQRLAAGLKSDIGDAADQVGRASDYYKAMGDYAHAAKLQEWYDLAKKMAIKGAFAAAGGGAAAVGGKMMYDSLKD